MGWLWLFAVLNSVESVVFLALFWWFLFFWVWATLESVYRCFLVGTICGARILLYFLHSRSIESPVSGSVSFFMFC
jgi:hypothetical protein